MAKKKAETVKSVGIVLTDSVFQKIMEIEDSLTEFTPELEIFNSVMEAGKIDAKGDHHIALIPQAYIYAATRFPEIAKSLKSDSLDKIIKGMVVAAHVTFDDADYDGVKVPEQKAEEVVHNRRESDKVPKGKAKTSKSEEKVAKAKKSEAKKAEEVKTEPEPKTKADIAEERSGRAAKLWAQREERKAEKAEAKAQEMRANAIKAKEELIVTLEKEILTKREEIEKNKTLLAEAKAKLAEFKPEPKKHGGRPGPRPRDERGFSTKHQVYFMWLKSGGRLNEDQLWEEYPLVMKKTIKGWIRRWPKGKGLPSGV